MPRMGGLEEQAGRGVVHGNLSFRPAEKVTAATQEIYDCSVLHRFSAFHISPFHSNNLFSLQPYVYCAHISEKLLKSPATSMTP